jgi:hypothetical protein
MLDMSPFRDGFLKVALYISGGWVDIDLDDLKDDGVEITRGAQNEGSVGAPSRMTMSLKDPTGKWNPRHPSSQYYGLIGRGTPIRVQVEMTAGATLDRWYGQVVTWEPRWTTTGDEASRVDIEAAGTLRQIGQGSSPLRSVLFRACSDLGSDLVAYWPMEDGANATQYAAAVPIPGNAIVITGTPDNANYSGFASSEDLPTVESAMFTATVPTYTSGTGCQVRWVGMIPTATPNGAVVLRVYLAGTLARVDVSYVTSNSIKVEGFTTAGVSVGSNTYAGLSATAYRFSLELATSGGNVAASIAVLAPLATSALTGTGTLTAVALGAIKKVIVNPNQAALADLAFGHLTVESSNTTLFDVSGDPLAAYAGEAAEDRIERLCTENGLTYAAYSSTGSRLMGVQGTTDLLSLLRECEATDGGMLYEPKSTTDLSYRTLESLYSQTAIALTYVENQFLPFEPTEDDQALRNKVTVKRDGGASAIAEDTTSPLATSSIGIYDEQVTLSLYADADAEQQANWRLHLGTVNEARWPRIGVDLADTRILPRTTLRDTLLSIDLGSRISITGIPSWLPPFAVDQIVLGYTETITPLHYRLVFNCTPASAYRAGFYNASTDRYSGSGTVLNGAIATTTATSIPVTPPSGISWTHADGDYAILINGEKMTVTNVVGNTLTVTRAVNGVAKTHANGSAVTLADPCYYGL